jgi:Exonuclease V - a 5' deoxyribonuclease
MNGSEQNVLEKLHKSGITATDIATQFWCEKQLELNYLYKPTPTKAMEKGARMHEAWQAKVYVPLTVETRTYSDVMFKIAYENYTTLQKLKSEKVGRELMVYGSMNGYRFSGKIDELRIKENKVAIVEDKTVYKHMTADEPHTRPHVVQVMLYRKMLGDIKEKLYSYDNFSNIYRLKSAKLSEEFVKGLRAIGLKDEYINIESMYARMFQEMQSMPELSDDLEIRYTDRRTNETVADLNVKYDPAAIAKSIGYAMQYWRGEREASPVIESENWKCKPCKFFGNQCKVWWTGG